jgi:hypothetical protein
MNKGRRIGAIIAATVAAIGMSMTLSTAPAAAAEKPEGPLPVSQLLHRVDHNDSAWVQVWFRTDKRACDFKLRVRDTGRVGIYHPKGSFTSLQNNASLSKDEIDYAAFRVDVGNYKKDTWQLLPATISWKWCGTAKVRTKKTAFLLPIDAD